MIYFTHGEPPAYSAMPWLETFRELDADKAPFIPAPFRALFFLQYRGEYLELGGSAHNKVHEAMLRSLEESMPEARAQGVRFYLAFLDSNPRPDEVAVRAVNEGARKIVLASAFLTESSHTLAGKAMVDALDLGRYGVSTLSTEPLWDSDALKRMFVTRANQRRGATDRARLGILLVGHGQPDAWDKLYPGQTAQETSFREDVKQMLVEDGYKAENIALAWMEFKEPKPASAASQLARQGVEKLYIFPASISADSIHSDIQIPRQVQAARLPAGVQVVNLGAWGDDPLVIQAIREKVSACLEQ